jgi:DNA-binding NarL/FixJ family response regulator
MILLTIREQQVRDGILACLRNKEIADRLHIVERTVKYHAVNVYKKYGITGLGKRGKRRKLRAKFKAAA